MSEMKKTNRAGGGIQKLTRGFNVTESAIYGVVSMILILSAAVLIAGALYNFFSDILHAGIEHSVLRVLEDMLLVIMLAEILHTVGYTLKHRELVCEPFLVVGVIAAVRRMLIITAEMGVPTEANQVSFKLAMMELGLLTLSVLTLCAGIYLLRRLRSPVTEDSAIKDS